MSSPPDRTPAPNPRSGDERQTSMRGVLVDEISESEVFASAQNVVRGHALYVQ